METKQKKDTMSSENHQQVMARLGIHGGFVFAHGTPTKKAKKG